MTTATASGEDSVLSGLAAGEAGSVVCLAGGNFSGRSALLAVLAAAVTAAGRRALLIPPAVHWGFTQGVATVEEELLVQVGPRAQARVFWSLAQAWGLLASSDQDPKDLSGGQQALLATLCKLSRQPHLLGLDGTLEQLDPRNTARVLAALHSAEFTLPTVTVLAHNGSWPPGVSLPASFPMELVGDAVRPAAPPPVDASRFAPPPIHEPVTIEVCKASFHYKKGRPVFSNLEFTLSPGFIYLLAGENGAGKSTFANVLCGNLRLTSGSIRRNGQPFDPYRRPGTLACLHFQDPAMQLSETTVRGELATLRADRRESAAVLAGVQHHLDAHPFDLPFVLQKRLSLGLIAHADAPWLIFDEPSLGLDAAARAQVAIALSRLAAAGHGVLVISHHQEFRDSLSPQIIELLPSR